jgi:copper(I)-binding protein
MIAKAEHMKTRIKGFGLLLAVLTPTVLTPALATAHEFEAGGIAVAHPWARATPEGAKVGAAFMEIKAKSGAADVLVSASTPAAGRVEIHTHSMDGGVMKMRRLDKLPIADGGSAVLRPSGDHIMLFDLKQPLREGDVLPLTLVFEKAGELKVEATVEPVGAKGPHGVESQPEPKAGAGHDHH